MGTRANFTLSLSKKVTLLGLSLLTASAHVACAKKKGRAVGAPPVASPPSPSVVPPGPQPLIGSSWCYFDESSLQPTVIESVFSGDPRSGGFATTYLIALGRDGRLSRYQWEQRVMWSEIAFAQRPQTPNSRGVLTLEYLPAAQAPRAAVEFQDQYQRASVFRRASGTEIPAVPPEVLVRMLGVQGPQGPGLETHAFPCASLLGRPAELATPKSIFDYLLIDRPGQFIQGEMGRVLSGLVAPLREIPVRATDLRGSSWCSVAESGDGRRPELRYTILSFGTRSVAISTHLASSFARFHGEGPLWGGVHGSLSTIASRSSPVTVIEDRDGRFLTEHRSDMRGGRRGLVRTNYALAQDGAGTRLLVGFNLRSSERARIGDEDVFVRCDDPRLDRIGEGRGQFLRWLAENQLSWINRW